MAYRLKERYPGVALVTGASAGIGAAFAHGLAKEGMDLILVARRLDRLETLSETLHKQHGITSHSIALDLAGAQAAEALRAEVDALGLHVSLLLNNAGFGSLGRFHALDPAWEQSMVELNCRTPVALSSTFVPAMVEKKNGAVIFVASTASYQATPFMSTYGATKVFNLHLAEALHVELRPFGVDVMAICPGYTETEFQEVAQFKDLPPSFLWRKPEQVVETCFRALGRRASVIDGPLNKFGAFMTRFIPRRLAATAAGKAMKPK